jgi:ribosome-associated heat shock protein Hsp15
VTAALAPQSEPESQRLDSWLWCARFFPSRAQAAHAIRAGNVRLKRGALTIEHLKPATPLKVGDGVSLLRGDHLIAFMVLALAPRRLPASKAREIYE